MQQIWSATGRRKRATLKFEFAHPEREQLK